MPSCFGACSARPFWRGPWPFSQHAHAQDAQALFDDGLGNMKAGRYKIGCALIKRSLDVDARPGTVFTLAECYSRAGKFASAVSYYDRFLVEYETMPLEQKLQQQARAELSRTERTRLVAQVAWLTVMLPAPAPPGVAGHPGRRGVQRRLVRSSDGRRSRPARVHDARPRRPLDRAAHRHRAR